jgi:hypothetical protein
VQRFMDDLRSTLRDATRAVVSDRINGLRRELTREPTRAEPSRGGPRRLAARAARQPAPAARAPTRRTRHDIAALRDAIVRYVELHPGQGGSELCRELGVHSTELAFPLKQLVQEGRLAREGRTRGTVYFVSSEPVAASGEAPLASD